LFGRRSYQLVQESRGFAEQDLINNIMGKGKELCLNLKKKNFNKMLQSHAKGVSKEDLRKFEDNMMEDKVSELE
jgi:hypothetical protein